MLTNLFSDNITIYCMIRILPSDLTFGDVHASLRHEAHPSLGLFSAEGVEIVDVWRLLCDLKVTDAAVPLHTHIHRNTHIKHVIIKDGKIDLHIFLCSRFESMSLYLSTEVDHVRVCIIIW